MAYIEIDIFLWRPGWKLAPIEEYEAEHARLIGGERWLLDGIGSFESIPTRLDRATEIVLADLPLWVHFWLAAERQVAYATGKIEHPPAGEPTMPPTKGLFQNIARIDRDWMPAIRRLIAAEEGAGKTVAHLTSLEGLDAFASRSGRGPACCLTRNRGASLIRANHKSRPAARRGADER